MRDQHALDGVGLPARVLGLGGGARAGFGLAACVRARVGRCVIVYRQVGRGDAADG